jgi:hypothetical protein
MLWRESSCDREKRWRDCPERVLREAWSKRSSKHFIIDAPFLFLEHPLHLVAGIRFVPSDRIACFLFHLQSEALAGRQTAIGFLGLTTPSRDSQLGPVYGFTYL